LIWSEPALLDLNEIAEYMHWTIRPRHPATSGGYSIGLFDSKSIRIPGNRSPNSHVRIIGKSSFRPAVYSIESRKLPFTYCISCGRKDSCGPTFLTKAIVRNNASQPICYGTRVSCCRESTADRHLRCSNSTNPSSLIVLFITGEMFSVEHDLWEKKIALSHRHSQDSLLRISI
jgi:hypothetical protein